jgi:hypothetical protein
LRDFAEQLYVVCLEVEQQRCEDAAHDNEQCDRLVLQNNLAQHEHG